MGYRIEFTPAGRRDFEALTKVMRRRIDIALRLLQDNPRPPKAERLQGKLREYHRVRVVDFRVIYLIEDEKLVVCVIRIGHRKDVYR